MSVPQSTIGICKGVRLTPSYTHTIYFDTKIDQANYFAGKVVRTFSAYSYLRKNWDITVDATYEQAREWTYLFLNNGTGSKTYYYFITDIEYIADGSVKLKLELDVMQTYMFDYELLPCFVEREHVSNDEVGINTIDEGLELGEYIINSEQHVENLNEYCVLVLSSINPELTTEETTVRTTANGFNGVFSGLSIYAVTNDKYTSLSQKLNDLDSWGKSDAIIAMWMYPKNLVNLADTENWISDKVFKTVAGARSITQPFETQEKLNSYTPKNKKLLTYPYNFLYVTNNCGESAVYHYERFYSDTLFNIGGVLSPEGSVRMWPRNYKNVAFNYDEGITINGYPSCAWNQDIYKLWLAQNQNQNKLNNTQALLTMGAGVATMAASLFTGAGGLVGGGAGVGMFASGMMQAQSLMAQKRDMAIQPPQAKGSFSPSLNAIYGKQTFTLQKKSIDIYHAIMIDKYFDMYGYKVNSVKIPNCKVRENWTYTKTVNCCIDGDISTNDKLKIESIYNNGVTFWVDGDRIGNYAFTNEIV